MKLLLAPLSLLMMFLGPQAQQKPAPITVPDTVAAGILTCGDAKNPCFTISASPEPPPETFTHSSEKDGFSDYTLHLHPDWNCAMVTNNTANWRNNATMIQVVCVRKEPK